MFPMDIYNNIRKTLVRHPKLDAEGVAKELNLKTSKPGKYNVRLVKAVINDKLVADDVRKIDLCFKKGYRSADAVKRSYPSITAPTGVVGDLVRQAVVKQIKE